MKRVASLFLIALVAVVLPLVVSDDVTAQDQVHVTPAAELAATDIVNGRIVSTISVELNGEMHRVSEVEISSTPKGSARGSVLVEVPGGERPDGTVVYVSHTPQLEQGELVQLALVPADHDIAYGLPVAAGRDLPVFSVAHGIDGAYGLLPDGVGRAQAVGDYALTGSSWPDFSPAVDYYVNPANAGVSSANAIAGVRKAFAMWENDPASDINFNYRGTTTKSGQNLNDGQVVVSWGSYSSSWLAQASWIATGSGDIISFDVRINTKYRWSNGAAPGRYDIGTVVGHEVGHGLGLNHAPASSELMYFQIQQSTVKPLGSGDRSGVASLYPLPAGYVRSQTFSQSGSGLGISSESNDRFGDVVVTGDFNNDGRQDFAAASPGENGGQGAVVVMYRSSTGNTSFAYFSQNTSGVPGTAETGDLFGASLAVGDFNGDSIDDLAIGSPGEDLNSGAGAGLVHVLYGVNGGLTTSGSVSLHQDTAGVPGGSEAGDKFGSALAAGDFNNDGRDDLAVGVPGEALGSLSQAGMINVLYGSSNGISGSNARGFAQSTAGIAGSAEATDQFGSALAAGDFNNDGRDDLAVGVPGEALGSLSQAGVINVLYGSSSGITTSGSTSFAQSSPGVPGGAESGDRFGDTLAAGDFNNDGRDDLAVGVPGEAVGSSTNAGVVNVLYGTSNGISGSGSQILLQSMGGVSGTSEAGDYFGASLAAGDVDGDGRTDLAVGVPGEGFGSVSNNGMIHVFYSTSSGLTGSGSENWAQSTAGVAGSYEANDDFGGAVAIGDFDNDGCADVATGVPGENSNSGHVSVLFGSDAAPGQC